VALVRGGDAVYIQVIRGKVVDTDGWHELEQRWHDELRPQAVGFLGSTEGITDDGRFVVAARFESADAARENSARPEQDAWWSDMSKVVSEVDVHDCSQVIPMLGGGSDDAGFVQVMVGRIKDRAKFDALNARTAELEKVFTDWRDDVLGEVLAVLDDGSGYTDVVYFRSEAEARAGEQRPPTAEVQAALADMDAATEVVEYLDLREPRMR
jgi:hypothetical protein